MLHTVEILNTEHRNLTHIHKLAIIGKASILPGPQSQGERLLLAATAARLSPCFDQACATRLVHFIA